MSFLSFLWNNNTTNDAAPATTDAAVNTLPLPSPPSADATSDEFILVDSEMADRTPTHAAGHAREASTDSWAEFDGVDATEVTPAILSAQNQARSCRLYGAAHKPPRLHPSSVSIAAAPERASAAPVTPATPSGKRSFAEILKANPAPVSTTRVAYAQDASASMAEALLAKITDLESAAAAAQAAVDAELAEKLGDPMLAALESINYSSPPIRPARPLSNASARLYDESWALDADEPNHKRAKRGVSPTIISLVAKADAQFKTKNRKPAARRHDLAVDRARTEKLAAAF